MDKVIVKLKMKKYLNLKRWTLTAYGTAYLQ